MLGWFTGAYAKEFTDARAELMRLRDQRNKLADSINNAGMAEIFRLDPAPEARYQHYINNTYNTAEGNAAMMYGQLGWVRAADGSEIQDDLRRDRIAELIHEDQITKEFYDNLTSLGEARDAQLMELPIGADSSQSRAVWKKYWNMVERLESDPKYENVRRTYVLGFKPTEMIEDYFERKFWQHLDSTKPRWRRDEGESYNDYLLREDAWKEHLPKLADQMVTEFFLKYMAGYSGKVPGDREFDAQNLASKLLSEVSREAYDEYRKDRDTPYDALNEAWRALYWDPYWTAVDTVDSDDPAEVELREQIERQFLAEHPEPPTEEELLAWVLKEYDDRFTHEELMLAMKGRKVTELDERLRADTMVGTLKEDTWNIFMWVGPGEQFNAFKNEALRMGVDEEEFALWFETGGDISFFKSYEEQQEFNDKLMEAARNLNITPPTDEQLQERVEAKRLNSQFRMGVERELGNGWYQEMSYFYSLNSTEKKAFKEENPTFEDRLDRYYDMRDFFAQENPLWAEYYHSEALEESKRGTSGGRSGGYSGRSYARSGGTSVQQVPTIPWLGMGMRGLEADELLTGKLGKGGVTKKPYWPAGFTKVVGQGVSQEIVRFIENDEPLSNPAINLLNDVKERHEKYKEFIETILHGGGGGPYLIE
jgi:hypothetical protein